MKAIYLPEKSWAKQKWYLLDNGCQICVEDSYYGDMVTAIKYNGYFWHCSDSLKTLPDIFKWVLDWRKEYQKDQYILSPSGHIQFFDRYGTKGTNIIEDTFFDEAFENLNVPDDIRRASERIVRLYGIKGICDPGYIANIIAVELNRGDGCGRFYEPQPVVGLT